MVVQGNIQFVLLALSEAPLEQHGSSTNPSSKQIYVIVHNRWADWLIEHPVGNLFGFSIM